MNINIKRIPQGEIIEEGDLVIDSISPEESVVMLVVKNSDSDYNVVVFDGQYHEKTEVFMKHVSDLSQKELQQNYRLLAKAEDVKITIEY